MPDRRRVLALIAASPGLAALDLRPAAAQAADLVARMTLEEKLGQLTLLSANLAVTGPTVTGNLDADVRAGRVGGVFNLWGRDAVRAAQRTAVEETRLGIPHFFGFDVIHGSRTVFPIPLAEAGAFDPALWEAMARHAAEEAAAAVLATARPVVVLLFSGRPLAMPQVFEKAAAVVACWFPGSEAGHAVAGLLTGASPPSASLAVTWPRHVGQVPIAYSVRSGGRPENRADKYTSKYLDLPSSPQFAFGHGLAYTSFALADPLVTAAAGRVVVETAVANTGPRPGTATVFLFARDLVASIARPLLELRRFRKVALGPGESQPQRFELDRSDFAFPSLDLRPVVEPGEIELHLGLPAAPEALRSTGFVLR